MGGAVSAGAGLERAVQVARGVREAVEREAARARATVGDGDPAYHEGRADGVEQVVRELEREVARSRPGDGAGGTGYRLVLPYPPSANQLYVTTRNGRALKPAQLDFRLRARALLWERYGADVEPLLGPVHVDLQAFRPRRRGDLDNLLKATLDAISGRGGLVWDDDQVTSIRARRYEDPRDPRLVLAVRPDDGGEDPDRA